MDVVRGNATLFMRRDEVEAAWRWVEPILEAWGAERGAAQALSRRQLGADRRDRADRARRPHLVRGSPLTLPSPETRHARASRHRRGHRAHPRSAAPTAAAAYLERLDAMAERGPRRTALSCGNLAHAFAACGDARQGPAERRRRRPTSASSPPTTTCSRPTSPTSASPSSSARPRARPARWPRSPAACPPCATASPRARPAWSCRCSAAT